MCRRYVASPGQIHPLYKVEAIWEPVNTIIGLRVIVSNKRCIASGHAMNTTDKIIISTSADERS
jgi:hypothetical protein